jgi:hypothetical protein
MDGPRLSASFAGRAFGLASDFGARAAHQIAPQSHEPRLTGSRTRKISLQMPMVDDRAFAIGYLLDRALSVVLRRKAASAVSEEVPK